MYGIPSLTQALFIAYRGEILSRPSITKSTSFTTSSAVNGFIETGKGSNFTYGFSLFNFS
jgi:hypothetical protein